MYSYGYSYGYGLIGGNTYNPLINYDWSTTTAQEYRTDGVELVVNGGFDTDLSGWTIQGNTVFESGACRLISDGTYSAIEQPNIIKNGVSYLVKISVLEITGTIDVVLGGGTNYSISTVGDHEFFITSTSTLFYIARKFGGSSNALFDNISIQKVIQEPNKRYLNDVGSTPTYNASMYFGRGTYLNGVDQTITVPINTTIQTALKRVNGVVTISETSQTLTNYVISGLGVHKDYYLFTRLLTTAEKDSYTNTPELFYAMAQADNTCVLNMPMCETDGYVRDMKSYSEGADTIVNGDLSNGLIGWSNVAISIQNENNKLKISHNDGTINGLVTNTGLISSGLNVVSFDYDFTGLNVSSFNIFFGINNNYFFVENSSTRTIGKFKEIVNLPISGTLRIGLGTYDSISSVSVLDNISIKPLLGAYPITNYTSSVRDNAKNLQYGLQTCKFVRDSLGVIQSASDYLECDKVGYADTGWMPSVGKDWSIELICQSKGVTDFGVQSTGWLIVSQSQGNKYFIYTKNSFINTVNSYLYGSSVCLSLVYTEKLKTLTLYENSIYVNSITMDTSIYPLTINFLLGKRNGGGQLSEGILKLFKVHNKELTQAEITKNYNSYVAKGLLS